MLYKAVLAFESVVKILCITIELKGPSVISSMLQDSKNAPFGRLGLLTQGK